MYQIAQFKQLRLWYQQASRSEDQDKGGIARANTYFDFEHKVTDLSGPKGFAGTQGGIESGTKLFEIGSEWHQLRRNLPSIG